MLTSIQPERLGNHRFVQPCDAATRFFKATMLVVMRSFRVGPRTSPLLRSTTLASHYAHPFALVGR